MAELVGGAAVGSVFGELLEAVLEMKNKARLFKQKLVTLKSTLLAISPAINKIAQHNNELDRSKQELEPLIKEMEKGIQLVCKCSKIHCLNCVARIRYEEQLEALMNFLFIFFTINVPAYTLRDQTETLILVRKMLSRVSKLPDVSTDTTGSASDFVTMSVDNSEPEICDAKGTQPADENVIKTDSTKEVMEHISQGIKCLSSNSYPVLMDVNESETPTTLSESAKIAAAVDYAKQATTSNTLEVGQSAIKAESSQATQQLMNEKSYDQCTVEKKFLGGAALRAAFGELLNAVLEMKDKAVMFRQTLADLQSTLEAIGPVVKEIEQYNNDLDRPKEQELLIRKMEEGTELVSKCSKINRLNYIARVRCQEQLVELEDSLVRLFIIDMQAQNAREQKETLLKVRRISSRIDKLPIVTADTTCSSSDFVPMSMDISETEICGTMETQPANGNEAKAKANSTG